MAKTLRMTFINGNNQKWSLTLPEPKNTLTTGEVEAAMDEVISSGIIRPNGASLVAPYRALLVDSATTVLYEAKD
jgi:hypothetical protein